MSKEKTHNVVLGATGSIASIKCPQIISILQNNIISFKIKLVPTRNALPFLALKEISQNSSNVDIVLHPDPSLLSDKHSSDNHLDLQPPKNIKMDHISIAKWADIILIAPATANFISKLANGIADDLLSTICISSTAKIFVAPAMNQAMWRNKATQSNADKLKKNGVFLIGPDYGPQACGDIGPGRLSNPKEICARICHFIDFSHSLSGKKVLVTAGPTREPLDPVRYLSNRSSGKMGYAIVDACIESGAEVVLVSGPVSNHSIRNPPCKVISVETAVEMHNAVFNEIEDADVFIACAAVSDFRPKRCSTSKIKTGDDGHASKLEMTIELTRNPHILKDVKERYPEKFIVGFAAETNDLAYNAKRKFDERIIDVLVANKVGKNIGFDSDFNEITILSRMGRNETFSGRKTELGYTIVDFITKMMGRKGD